MYRSFVPSCAGRKGTGRCCWRGSESRRAAQRRAGPGPGPASFGVSGQPSTVGNGCCLCASEPAALHAEKCLSAVPILPGTSAHRFSCSPAKSQGFAVSVTREEVRQCAAALHPARRSRSMGVLYTSSNSPVLVLPARWVSAKPSRR